MNTEETMETVASAIGIWFEVLFVALVIFLFALPIGVIFMLKLRELEIMKEHFFEIWLLSFLTLANLILFGALTRQYPVSSRWYQHLPWWQQRWWLWLRTQCA